MNHPTMDLCLSVRREDYKSFSFQCPKVDSIQIQLDSCAQSGVWSLRDCSNAGFSREDLLPVSLSLSAANKSHIEIVGALFVCLEGLSADGKPISCSTLVYVSPNADWFFLSLEAMVDLGLINHDSALFPNELKRNFSEQGKNSSIENHDDSSSSEAHSHKGSCPTRSRTPFRPKSLPFEPSAENIPRMKEWLLETFVASTFNTCPHQSLPCMSGPEVQIHVDGEAKPKASHTPATIPIHWQDRIHSDLLRDERLGVIKRVPYGEPVDW